MAKKTVKKLEKISESEQPKKGLEIKVQLKTENGQVYTDEKRLVVKVSLLQDGVVISEDYDFVSV